MESNRDLVLDCGGGVSLELCPIPAGEFRMGSATQIAHFTDELPQHCVVISKPFFLGKFAVTQAQFATVDNVYVSGFEGSNRPIDGVTWKQTAQFCEALSTRTGRNVCLPTEAQWEYACLANSGYGADAMDPQQIDGIAWHGENSNCRTHPVGEKIPNAFGLYDMLGNVAEWCNDLYDAEYYASSPAIDPTGPPRSKAHFERVLRGDGWSTVPSGVRAARRTHRLPGLKVTWIGFRVAVV